mmetsp:Transcript_2250/g.5235  ORF Transcript_2250/g.5235 Transcript_2250/m.5235 type:complete len:226 (+) Transcript_2250:814-1491(+)
MICSTSKSTLEPADSATTENFSGCSLQMSNVCVPMEPVQPRIEMGFGVSLGSYPLGTFAVPGHAAPWYCMVVVMLLAPLLARNLLPLLPVVVLLPTAAWEPNPCREKPWWEPIRFDAFLAWLCVFIATMWAIPIVPDPRPAEGTPCLTGGTHLSPAIRQSAKQSKRPSSSSARRTRRGVPHPAKGRGGNPRGTKGRGAKPSGAEGRHAAAASGGLRLRPPPSRTR